MPHLKPNNVRVIRAAKPFCRRMTERGKVINPDYNIFRDQATAGASPLRINTLLCRGPKASTRHSEPRQSVQRRAQKYHQAVVQVLSHQRFFTACGSSRDLMDQHAGGLCGTERHHK